MMQRDQLEASWKTLNIKCQSLKNCDIINMYNAVVEQIDSSSHVQYGSMLLKWSTVMVSQSTSLQSKFQVYAQNMLMHYLINQLSLSSNIWENVVLPALKMFTPL